MNFQAYYILQRYTWAEVGKLDTGVMNRIVDEMMRTGSDGGIGSDKCEIMAETLSSMCSARVRGKILAKLRKVGVSVLVTLSLRCSTMQSFRR